MSSLDAKSPACEYSHVDFSEGAERGKKGETESMVDLGSS